MKILQVNKFLYPKAGTEAYLFALTDLLRDRGHEVRFFSMTHPENVPCEDAKYFVDRIDYEACGILDRFRSARKIVFSVEARREISLLLDELKPDIVHLHNFHHQLSPSILKPIARRKIPMVMTVHDLKVICPNYLMLSKGAVCERCKKHRYYNCFLQACVKGSRIGSLVNTVEMTLHWLLGSHGLIDRFLCPSAFYRDKLIEWGIPSEKVLHVPNFVHFSEFTPTDEDDGSILYAGRISREKGILTLLHAMKKVPELRCRIAGAGPEEESARKLAKDFRLENVEFTGRLPRKELQHLMAKCRATVLPSEWYENGSIMVLESFALERPVVASEIGGNPETVRHEKTGLLFPAGDAEALAQMLRRTLDEKDRMREMGRAGRRLLKEEYSPEKNLEAVLRVYRELG